MFHANCRQRFFGGLRLLPFCREPDHHSSDARFEVGGLANQSEEILGAQGGSVEKNCQMRSHAEDDEIFGINAILFQRLQQLHHPLLTLCDFLGRFAEHLLFSTDVIQFEKRGSVLRFRETVQAPFDETGVDFLNGFHHALAPVGGHGPHKHVHGFLPLLWCVFHQWDPLFTEFYPVSGVAVCFGCEVFSQIPRVLEE